MYFFNAVLSKVKAISIGCWLLMTVPVLMPAIAFTQPDNDPDDLPENIESMRVAFFTKQLELKPDEAKLFWPKYEEFQRELRANRRLLLREAVEARFALPDMTEAEMEKALSRYFELQQKELDITKKYYAEFRKIITIKKTLKLIRTERMFRRELLRQIKGNKP